jgi:hypothetical protein
MTSFHSTLQYYFDRVLASRGWHRDRLALPSGATLTIEGWAFNAAQRAPSAVWSVVDGVRVSEGTARLSRPDVAASLGPAVPAEVGFRIEIPSRSLPRGNHELELVFAFGAGEQDERTPVTAFEIYAEVEFPARTERPRILLAAAPKSGSTYVSNVLQQYYRFQNPPTAYSLMQEHLLVERFGDQPYVLQAHCMATKSNLELIREQSMAPVVTWRNLADVIISFDDHVRNEGVEGAAGIFMYVGNRDDYLAMADQQRYRFLIRNMLPWYLGFYLGWRDAGAPLLVHYEELVDAPLTFFSRIVERISGSVDEIRLGEALRVGVEGSRLNVGRNGRALEKFSDESRRLLEDALREHYADLSDLIAELPWRRAAT